MHILPEQSEMKIYTIYAPRELIKFFDMMVNDGMYPSRSEIIRKCIYNALPKLIEEMKMIRKLMAGGKRQDIKKYMENNGFVVKRPRKVRNEYTIPLGNPFWEFDTIDDDGSEIYVSKKDPNKIISIDAEGNTKEYNVIGEA